MWSVADGCEELLLLTPEHWKPERIIARKLAPFVLTAVFLSTVGSGLFDALTAP